MGRHKVASIMRKNGIVGLPPKKFRKTTNSDHNLPVAENLLDRKFDVECPNEAWVGDITYIWTARSWVYLAVILDLFSRRVVGWALDDHIRTELVLKALEMAKGHRGHGRTGQVFYFIQESIHHTRRFVFFLFCTKRREI